MKRIIIFVLAATISGSFHTALAQDSFQTIPIQYTPEQSPSTQAPAMPSLDERFQECMNDGSCPLQDRIQLMGEMSDEMRQSLRRMDQNCMKAGYKDCIGPKHEETRAWHKMHLHMDEMMTAMEKLSSTGGQMNKTPGRPEGQENDFRAESGRKN